ncbi:glutamine-rich protein 2-like isoform X2 [Dysidea avara]
MCLIKNNKSGNRGTGFIGYFPLHKSRYLLTCHHVLPGGRVEKKAIREADFTFNHNTDESVSYKGHQLFNMDRLYSFTSPVKVTEDEYGLDYTMIRIRDDVLLHCEPFELTDQYGVAPEDQVAILQHAGGEQLGISNHNCKDKIGFLVYYVADTDRGSSGAPVLRMIDRKYRVVAIHRGVEVLNYGSLLSEIIYHVQNMEISPGSMTTSKMVDDFKKRQLQPVAVIPQHGPQQPDQPEPDGPQRGHQQPAVPQRQPAVPQLGQHHPAVLQPGQQQPAVLQLGQHQPAVLQPGQQQPAVPKLGQHQPGVLQPGQQQPAVPQVGQHQPAVLQPAVLQPGQQQPAVPQVGQHQPGVLQPGQQQPAVPKLGQHQPAVPQPAQQQPAAPQHQPAVPQLGQHQPAVLQPGQQQPAVPQLGQHQPAVLQPGQQQPAVPQVGQYQPAVLQPGQQQPAVPKLGQHQPAVPQPAQQQPAVPQFGQPAAPQCNQQQPAIPQHGQQHGQQQPEPGGLHRPIPQQQPVMQQPAVPQCNQQQLAIPPLGQEQPAVPRSNQQPPAEPQPPIGVRQPTTQQSIMTVIHRIYPDMRKYINISSLYPYLNKYGILTREERAKLINPYTSQIEKIDELLKLMGAKSPSSQSDFLKAIKDAREHTGHKEICKLLREKGLRI